jgi:hypothetical protein
MIGLILLSIYLLLGTHSLYYLIREARKEDDITIEDIPYLILAFLVPIISHYATYITFVKGNDEKIILFHKKK